MAGKQFQWEKESMMCEVMCKAIKDMIDESKTEGVAEGILNQAKKMALRMYEDGDSIEKIAKTADVPVNLVKEWINSAGCV